MAVESPVTHRTDHVRRGRVLLAKDEVAVLDRHGPGRPSVDRHPSSGQVDGRRQPLGWRRLANVIFDLRLDLLRALPLFFRPQLVWGRVAVERDAEASGLDLADVVAALDDDVADHGADPRGDDR